MKNDSSTRAQRQDAIPEVLAKAGRWLGWELRKNRQGKHTKVPDRSTKDTSKLSTLTEALAGREWNEKGGIGFAFTNGYTLPEGRIYSLDLDGCRDPITGTIEPWAMAIVEHYGRTFSEVTPSGCGLRVWIIVRDYPKSLAVAKIKLDYPRAPNVPEHKPVEIQIFGYGVPQYVTVTGHIVPGCGTEIEITPNLDYLVETFGFATSNADVQAKKLPESEGEKPTANHVEVVLRNSPSADLIFEADWQNANLGGDDPSASGAYWRVAQEVLRAANGHGDVALQVLQTRTDWGIGAVEESADPAKYGRTSWIAAELVRASAKVGNVASAEDIFGGEHELDENYILPEVGPLEGTQAAMDAMVQASPLRHLGGKRRTSFFDREPPPREYLLKHPGGDGFLPRGKVGLFSAAGGTGKTTALVQLAVAIATREPWLNHFEIGESSGRDVLMLLAEEDEDEVWRKIFYTCKNMGLTRDQQRLVDKHVITEALAGHSTPLMKQAEHGNPVGTHHSDALMERLNQGNDWGLVVIDPISRFAGINVEGDNTIATRFVVELERFTQAPGNPSLLGAGHTSKEARRTGTADQRGVTGLFDAVRWVATMVTKSKHRVEFEVPKNNLGRPSDMVPLVRGDQGLLYAETRGQLHEREEAEHLQILEKAAAKEDTKVAAREKRLNDVMVHVVEKVRAHPGSSKATILKLVKGKKADAIDATERAIFSGMLEVRLEGKAHNLFVSELFK
tara:strand:- start:946 stop:3144 length:2199 start_codon:yes stop_codon:yes gene_type:complete